MLKKILAVLALLYAAASWAAVDVNKATAAELDGVKGIGPTTSKAIIDERKKHGEFKSWEDFISRTKGIGESKAAALSKEGLTVGGAEYKKAAAKDAKASKKDEKKEAKADAKAEKKEEKTAAKDAKKDDKTAAAAKPAAAASAKK
ncbi:helix-hairpin-helix domain-containing protein [Ramlibacter sp. USB13]|uniref:Helix-hairpin-helix domain-containing protein n=1 Tax=Ramlibacter cellulosilyticus TaxID=2764187 RepID=A0A923MSV7_9BURK|nr:helix-hairpin-helix domain-containing protein [Ramlibacter cellulosilyticus]MBC5784835.1 helix-hairpin-helix domain-containing protein [Ramlibacter cellulosilyticus]